MFGWYLSFICYAQCHVLYLVIFSCHGCFSIQGVWMTFGWRGSTCHCPPASMALSGAKPPCSATLSRTASPRISVSMSPALPPSPARTCGWNMSAGESCKQAIILLREFVCLEETRVLLIAPNCSRKQETCIYWWGICFVSIVWSNSKALQFTYNKQHCIEIKNAESIWYRVTIMIQLCIQNQLKFTIIFHIPAPLLRVMVYFEIDLDACFVSWLYTGGSVVLPWS